MMPFTTSCGTVNAKRTMRVPGVPPRKIRVLNRHFRDSPDGNATSPANISLSTMGKNSPADRLRRHAKC